jgi:hypothetical protein
MIGRIRGEAAAVFIYIFVVGGADAVPDAAVAIVLPVDKTRPLALGRPGEVYQERDQNYTVHPVNIVLITGGCKAGKAPASHFSNSRLIVIFATVNALLNIQLSLLSFLRSTCSHVP